MTQFSKAVREVGFERSVVDVIGSVAELQEMQTICAILQLDYFGGTKERALTDRFEQLV